MLSFNFGLNLGPSKISKLITSSVLLALLFSTPSHSSSPSLAPLATTQKLIELYEAAAFNSSKKTLLKLSPKDQYQTNFICLAQDCKNASENLGPLSLLKQRFQITPSADYDLSADITIALVKKKRQAENAQFFAKSMFDVAPTESVMKDLATGCASFTLRNSNELKRVVVLVENTASQRMNVSCILSQLGRASGLSFKENFDQLWAPNSELSKLSDSEFDSTMTVYAALLSIQDIPITKSGMGQTEVDAILKGLSREKLLGN